MSGPGPAGTASMDVGYLGYTTVIFNESVISFTAVFVGCDVAGLPGPWESSYFYTITTVLVHTWHPSRTENIRQLTPYTNSTCTSININTGLDHCLTWASTCTFDHQQLTRPTIALDVNKDQHQAVYGVPYRNKWSKIAVGCPKLVCVCPCWWYFLPYQWARGLHASTVSAPRQYAVTGGLRSELGSGWQALGKVQGTPPLPSNATHRGGAAKQQRIILLSTGAHATSSFSAVLAPIFLISSLLPSPPLLLLSPFLASFLSAASLVLSIPNVQEHPRSCSPPLHRLLPFSKMAARPQNIGIKAIEIYFPSQVRAFGSEEQLLRANN